MMSFYVGMFTFGKLIEIMLGSKVICRQSYKQINEAITESELVTSGVTKRSKLGALLFLLQIIGKIHPLC